MSPSSPPRRWYREPWLWLVIAIPLLAVTVSLFNVYLALSGRDDEVRTVKDDIYQEGKSVNQRFQREQAAVRLNLHADFRVDEVTGEVFATLRASAPVTAPALTLNFEHQTQSRQDQTLTLQRVMGNDYRGQLDHALNGIYRVELATADWRLLGTRRFPLTDNVFSLDPM